MMDHIWLLQASIPSPTLPAKKQLQQSFVSLANNNIRTAKANFCIRTVSHTFNYFCQLLSHFPLLPPLLSHFFFTKLAFDKLTHTHPHIWHTFSIFRPTYSNFFGIFSYSLSTFGTLHYTLGVFAHLCSFLKIWHLFLHFLNV